MGQMPQKWKIALMLFMIAALNYGDRTAISSVFPLLRADLALSDVVMAGIGSVFLWSYAIGSPVAGYLADRLSRSRVVLFSLVAWSSVMLLTAFAQSSGFLLLTRALLGIAECAYLPAATALIADHHKPDTRGTAMGIQIAGMQIGLVAGSAIAGYIGEHFGWRVDFFILGGAGLLLSLAASFILRDSPAGVQPAALPSSGWGGVGQLLRIPGYVSVVSGAMLIAIGTWILLNWLPLYFHERFHMSLAGAGFSSSSMLQVAAIVGVTIGGFISDRTAGSSPKGRILLLAICYFCAAPFLLSFLWNASLGTINASVFLYSFLKSVGAASECPIICEVAGPRLRSTGLGILNMMNCLAGGAGVMWAGFLKRDYGLGTAFGGISATVSAAGVAVLVGYFFVRRQERQTALAGEPPRQQRPGMLDERSTDLETSVAPPGRS
jgi:predicted MFS family arabinose efflux permease